MTDFIKQEAAPLLTIAFTCVSALWALFLFARNSRIKAAEILIEVENQYAKHIPVLLQIEYKTEYDENFRTPLTKILDTQQAILSRTESLAIDRLEAALRHFYVCECIMRLGINRSAIDRLCSYYLRVLVTDRYGDMCNPTRPELSKYVGLYWPSVYLWAPLAAKPWPVRACVRFFQIPNRITLWWTGSIQLKESEKPS